VLRLDDAAGKVLRGQRCAIRSNARHLVTDALPDNLGNSAGGGWSDAPLDLFAPVMLAERGDLVPTAGGGLAIVDRTAQIVNRPWNEFILRAGLPGPKDVRWQRPKKIVVGVEQRFCAPLYVIETPVPEDAQATTAAPAENPRDLRPRVENVVPYPEVLVAGVNALPNLDAPAKFISFPEFFPLVPGGLTESRIRKRLLAPGLIDKNKLTAPQRAQASLAESLVRQFWRRCWRINDDTTRRAFADFRLGQLRADGTTDEQAVYMSWTAGFAYERWPGAPLSEPYSGRAPYVARWLSREDLVFQLVESARVAAAVGAIYPGHIDDPIRAPTYDELWDERKRLKTEAAAEISGFFQLEVYAHGLYVGGDAIYGRDRLYRQTLDLFSDGEVDEVQILMPGITANWLWETRRSEKYELLNGDALRARAEAIRDEVKASYEQKRAGVAVFGGLEILQQNIEVQGDLWEIGVHVGQQGDLWEISTTLDFRPGFAPFDLPPVVAAEPARIL